MKTEIFEMDDFFALPKRAQETIYGLTQALGIEGCTRVVVGESVWLWEQGKRPVVDPATGEIAYRVHRFDRG